MQPVESSMVSAVGYDPASRVLALQYKNGRTYTHAGVPERVFEQLMLSASKGAFINRTIKPRYPHR